MAVEDKDILGLFDELLKEGSTINIGDIPNIDLYMDQVTTFMGSQLAGTRRHDEDKVLTKTMINNYTKNKVLPPPEKKKYSREHILVLLFIYYLKDFLSFDDIQKILSPVTERFFHSDDSFDMQWLYSEILRLESVQHALIREDLEGVRDLADTAFADAPKKESEKLRTFALIGMLSYDVYMKKKIIEKLIDRNEKQ